MTRTRSAKITDLGGSDTHYQSMNVQIPQLKVCLAVLLKCFRFTHQRFQVSSIGDARLFTIEYQSPNLNALSRVPVLVGGILEGGVGRSSRHRCVGVEALDEHDLVCRLGILEEPTVGRIRLDGPRLTLMVGIYYLCSDEIAFAYRPGVGDGQRILEYGPDRAPELYERTDRLIICLSSMYYSSLCRR